MSYEFKNDRIEKYFDNIIGRFLFVEYSEEFMKKLGIEDIAKDIKVPISPIELKEFAGGEGVSATKIAENMVIVIGCNPNFRYADRYCLYIRKFFNERLVQDIVMAGVKYVEEKNYNMACIHFRAAVKLDPTMMEAVYNYARVCREMYTESDDEEFIGRFKAESMEAFEQLTIDYPDFDQPYYFLGYAYLNLGLYEKAGLAWEKFMILCKDPSVSSEIIQRLGQIQEPRRIESGCNAVISGKYMEGLEILIPFLNSNFETWWPLHFYIATAYEELGNETMATAEYQRVLQLNAGSIDSIDALIRIYEKNGNIEMAEKYIKKKEIVLKNLKLDAEDIE